MTHKHQIETLYSVRILNTLEVIAVFSKIAKCLTLIPLGRHSLLDSIDCTGRDNHDEQLYRPSESKTSTVATVERGKLTQRLNHSLSPFDADFARELMKYFLSGNFVSSGQETMEWKIEFSKSCRYCQAYGRKRRNL